MPRRVARIDLVVPVQLRSASFLHVSKATVLAHACLVSHQLNVLDWMSQRTASTVADRHIAVDLDRRLYGGCVGMGEGGRRWQGRLS